MPEHPTATLSLAKNAKSKEGINILHIITSVFDATSIGDSQTND